MQIDYHAIARAIMGAQLLDDGATVLEPGEFPDTRAPDSKNSSLSSSGILPCVPAGPQQRAPTVLTVAVAHAYLNGISCLEQHWPQNIDALFRHHACVYNLACTEICISRAMFKPLLAPIHQIRHISHPAPPRPSLYESRCMHNEYTAWDDEI